MEKLTEIQRLKGRTGIGFGDGSFVIDVWGKETCGTIEDHYEFSRRLYASFNACLPIPVEALEQQSINLQEDWAEFDRINTENASLKAVNAQLLDALKTVFVEMTDSTCTSTAAFLAVSNAISATTNTATP